MKQYTPEEIQAKFDSLPKMIQDAITSTNVNMQIEAIGKKYDLKIDQIGELVDQVGLVMIGLERSADFVGTMSARLSISKDVAYKIAEDINHEIFASIRDYMEDSLKAREEDNLRKMNDISAIEQAGDFSIEKNGFGHIDDSGHDIGAEQEQVPDAQPKPNKEETLSEIENPTPTPSIPMNRPLTTKTEPLIDQLLSQPMAQTEQKSVEDKTLRPPAPPQNPKSADLYREKL